MSRSRRHSYFFSTGAVVFGVFVMGVGAFLLWAAMLKIPDLKAFDERRVSQSTKIYDRTGKILLYDVHRDTKRTIVPLEEISRNIKNATVAIEDAEFYTHYGIKPRSIVRATIVNVSDRNFTQGGSTITQQVVKNSLLSPKKTITRKLKEWILAVKLEQALTKEQILALYLNETPYGGSIYGIEEASRAFFNKSARELTLSEAAYLAALPQAPTYFSPYGNHRADLDSRKDVVLLKMRENRFIDADEYEEARTERVFFQPQNDHGILAPHFVMYVREILENKYGRDVVEEGGFRVVTTLDYELQKKAEDIVGRAARENKEKFKAENAALVAIDPHTGHILTMVGSRDYFDPAIDGNFNVALAHRQPGSAFKPFVYATAFKKGYTPETVVFDVETEFSTACTPTSEPRYPDAECYRPGNYDNLFRGPVSFRNALAQSINVPAVKVLYLSGISDAIRTARDLGISSLTDAGRYGLTLVLGGGEVSLLEMTSAYGVFAADGTRYEHEPILRIENQDSRVIYESLPRQSDALDKGVARTVTDILSDNDARTPAFGESSQLYFPGFDVAAKTGTTNDYRDAWVVGYTSKIAVGAWAGNNDNSPMEKKVAGFIVAPLWNEFMREVLARETPSPFIKPERSSIASLKPILRGIWQGGETYIIDSLTGKLATVYTPQNLQEERVVPGIHSILFWVDRRDPTGAPPKNPESDPQFPSWEYAVRAWTTQQGIKQSPAMSFVPSDRDDIHTPESSPRLSIIGIRDSYSENETVQFSITTSGHYPLAKVDVFVNDALVRTGIEFPFTFFIPVQDIPGYTSSQTIRVVGYDTVSNRGETTAIFSVSP